MALGFDMADPIFRPPVTQNRVDDWKTFLNAWNKKPVFAGRYFGGANTWVWNELPTSDLKPPPKPDPSKPDLFEDLRPFFTDLKYIWVLTGTGPHARTTVRTVDENGDLLLDENGDPSPNGRWVFYEQQGETEDGTKRPADQIRALGRRAAKETCKAIAKQVERLDPFSPPVDLELPAARMVFVFLDVEPQTKLHMQYWRGWAETVLGYTINAGTSLQPELVQPFYPTLYCATEGNGPRLAAVRDVFADKRSPICFAVATGWNPTPPGIVFPTPAAGVAATEADVQANWPNFGDLQQHGMGGTPVVIWQYRINVPLAHPANPNTPFEIDLVATSANAYGGAPITDYMLKIIW